MHFFAPKPIKKAPPTEVRHPGCGLRGGCLYGTRGPALEVGALGHKEVDSVECAKRKWTKTFFVLRIKTILLCLL